MTIAERWSQLESGSRRRPNPRIDARGPAADRHQRTAPAIDNTASLPRYHV